MLVILGAAVALGVAIAQIRRRYLVVTVVGHSMLPTLHHGQKLVARRWRPGSAYGRLRAEIIVFVPPVTAGYQVDRDLPYRVKRVVAIAGDPAPPWLPVLPGTPAPDRVPPDMVAVLGDNPCSEDSRSYGWVSQASIVAHVTSTGGRGRGQTGPV
jgi:signal peptidase I